MELGLLLLFDVIFLIRSVELDDEVIIRVRRRGSTGAVVAVLLTLTMSR